MRFAIDADMQFKYSAKQRDGTAVSDSIDADNVDAARQQLRRDGLFIVSIAAAGRGGAATSSGRASNIRRPAKVKKSDLLMMLSQLNIMCQSGVDLAEAIKNVTEQISKPHFKKVLERVHDDISAGVSFSESLSRHPSVFDRTFVSSIAAGEQSGSIGPVLKRLTELVRRDIQLHSAVWSMMMYPIVLCIVTFLVLNALVFFVLPQFAKVFADLGRPAPPVTQVMLNFGETVSNHRVLLIGAVATVAVAIAILRNSRFVRGVLDHAMLNFIGLRKATRALLTGRCFRLLGAMLESGVPLIDGIKLCRDSVENRIYREMFNRVEYDVLHGEGIGKPLLESSCLPAGAAQMVATAERSGKLGEVMQSVGAHFEEEGERSIRDLVKVLEPAVIVVLGVIVAGVILSVVLPLLDVSSISH